MTSKGKSVFGSFFCPNWQCFLARYKTEPEGQAERVRFLHNQLKHDSSLFSLFFIKRKLVKENNDEVKYKPLDVKAFARI